MATHSSTIAWKIPWTEEPGELESMGSQRVGHHWVTEHRHCVIATVFCNWRCRRRTVLELQWSSQPLQKPEVAFSSAVLILLTFILKLVLSGRTAATHHLLTQPFHKAERLLFLIHSLCIKEENYFQKSPGPRQTFPHVSLARFVSLVYSKLISGKGNGLTCLD